MVDVSDLPINVDHKIDGILMVKCA